MRLPNSHNTKPHRNNALCQIHTLSDRRYPLAQFVKATPRKTVQTVQTAQTVQHSRELNPRLLDAVSKFDEGNICEIDGDTAWVESLDGEYDVWVDVVHLTSVTGKSRKLNKSTSQMTLFN